jgi:hypothetical protein
MRATLLKLGAALLILFAPIKAALATVMLLTLLDFVFGIRHAVKRKEKITSSGFKRTILKILAYETVIMLGFLVEQNLTGDLVPVVKVLSGLIGLTELKSVIENLQGITGTPLTKLLIEKLGQKEHDSL